MIASVKIIHKNAGSAFDSSVVEILGVYVVVDIVVEIGPDVQPHKIHQLTYCVDAVLIVETGRVEPVESHFSAPLYRLHDISRLKLNFKSKYKSIDVYLIFKYNIIAQTICQAI